MKNPNLKNEKEFWAKEILVCGVDEVGRGCLAGPVVAAAVIMPKNHKPIKNVRDSKQLTPKMRREVCENILDKCEDFGIGLMTASEIDTLGIEVATRRAMLDAIGQLNNKHGAVMIDAVKISEINVEQRNIIKGDESVYSISCASIVAKVFRDQIVSGLDNVYPEYFFSEHKGYATKKHREAIARNGITVEHRRSFLKKII